MPQNKERVSSKKTNQKKWKRIILACLIGFTVLIGILFGYYSITLDRFFTSVQDPDTDIDSQKNTEVLSATSPISVLLLGIDERPDDPGRSDTMILGTFNPHTKESFLVSIPRDTLITLPETEEELDKINATYTYGGVNQTVDAVKELLDIPINFYATLNFQGFIDLVDTVGGVDVEADFPFTVSGSDGSNGPVEIKKGRQHLNGEDALGYTRMRKQDPKGDFGRQDRQREVIQALLDKMISFQSLSKFNKILKVIEPNLSTNVSAEQAFSLANDYLPALETIHEETIPGSADSLYLPAYQQEVYIWVPDEEGMDILQTTLQSHLELKRPGYAPVQAEPLPS